MRPVSGGKKYFNAFMKAQLKANELMQTLYLDYKPKGRIWWITDKKSEDSMTIKPIPPEIMARLKMPRMKK